MKQVALLTTLGLALFATAAFAHQYGGHGRFSHVQHSGYTGTGCPMNTGMTGQGIMYGNHEMMNHNGMHRGMYTTTRPGSHTNWRANPVYQGQVEPDVSVE
jgi:hypothetical protein